MKSFLHRPLEDEEASHTYILGTVEAEETIRTKAVRLTQKQSARSRVRKGKSNQR